MRRILPILLVLLPAALAASDASVSGVVVDDSTGKPIRTALVTLSTTGSKPMEVAVYTDGNGAFQFNAVPPGRYYLHAREDRYQGVAFGAPTPDLYPAVLTLGSGEIRQGIDLRMRPLGVISGLVLDQDGDPLAHVNVSLMVSVWRRGHRTWVGRTGANTNDRGEFRIFGIAPGSYYLSASAQSVRGFRSQVTVGGSAPDAIVGRSYYPNATRIQDARPVEVKPGVEVRDIVLQMQATAAASVNFHIELPEGLNATRPIQLSLVPQDEGAGMPAGFAFGGTEFAQTALAPGHYTAITSLGGDNDYRGVDEIDLQPGTQKAVLHLRKGVPLAGHLQVQGPGGGDLTQYKITLIPGEVSPLRNRLNADVRQDGTFAFAAVTSGVWDIGVNPIPKGGYVKSMKLGGQDVLTADMTITPATSASLEIVLSTRGGAVSGTVKMPDDPGADLTGRARPVVLLAPAGEFSHVESFRMMGPADDAGAYEFTGITPGSYKVFAFDRLDGNAAQDPGFLARIDPLGKPVEVHEGDKIHLDLDMRPAPPAAAEPGGGQ